MLQRYHDARRRDAPFRARAQDSDVGAGSMVRSGGGHPRTLARASSRVFDSTRAAGSVTADGDAPRRRGEPFAVVYLAVERSCPVSTSSTLPRDRDSGQRGRLPHVHGDDREGSDHHRPSGREHCGSWCGTRGPKGSACVAPPEPPHGGSAPHARRSTSYVRRSASHTSGERASTRRGTASHVRRSGPSVARAAGVVGVSGRARRRAWAHPPGASPASKESGSLPTHVQRHAGC
jgi:hypothetical protein